MKLYKHMLDFEKVWPYFVDHLDCGKSLSKAIIEKVDLQNGLFYTFLPDNAHLEKLYKFKEGWIIPQNKEKEILVGKERNYIMQGVTNTTEEFCQYTFKYLNSFKEDLVIIEDAQMESTDANIEIENVKLSFHENEIYYILESDNTLKSITKTIKTTKHVWHFLAVFVKGVQNFPKNLDKRDFEEVCKNAKLIVVSAYDGESFIFWEKSDSATSEK